MAIYLIILSKLTIFTCRWLHIVHLSLLLILRMQLNCALRKVVRRFVTESRSISRSTQNVPSFLWKQLLFSTKLAFETLGIIGYSTCLCWRWTREHTDDTEQCISVTTFCLSLSAFRSSLQFVHFVQTSKAKDKTVVNFVLSKGKSAKRRYWSTYYVHTDAGLINQRSIRQR